ncbi:MAG: hypothetical protein FJW86_02010 [Actinobacteria bacterium]|nr:hypothetical protein [Actinomycetota bacterium]
MTTAWLLTLTERRRAARAAARTSAGHLHANVNNLTSTDDVDRLGGMALYSGVPVEIEGV